MKKKDESAVLRGEELQARIRELEAQVSAAETKVAAGEKGALDRVCKALKINPEELEAKEVATQPDEPIIRCYVPIPVRVNMTVYQGTVEVPKSTFHVIQQAIGDRRMRLMREMTGNNYVLKALGDVGFAPHLVGTVNEHGERIS